MKRNTPSTIENKDRQFELQYSSNGTIECCDKEVRTKTKSE